ncbi:hypothetical protein JXA32_02955 [Candidatus Sumerlaeota bacterium]|nr:hypothetical protein [Candidatus Sumerlaeota bacterium]
MAREQADPVDETVEAARLLDFYGAMLTGRQREFMTLHYCEDMSFGEIGEAFSVSRQAVHDAVRHGLAAMREMDAQLGLLEDFSQRRERHIQRMQALELLREARESLDAQEWDHEALKRQMDKVIMLLADARDTDVTEA